jgi:glycine/D-amino acid oxidase-like deaminating enzyme/nitrite reductase/ring-hydroxylating ferredoxin subunit
VGGGVTGLTTALRLIEDGRDVTVVEARHLAAGTTGGTTGKVTSQHGVLYRDLVDRHGEDVARTYAGLNQDAIDRIRQLCERYDIDARLGSAAAHVYASDDDEVARLEAELEIARRLGLPARWRDSTPELAFPTRGAIAFDDQAQLHAVAYVEGLARAVEAGGGRVHTGTRVAGVAERGDHVVATTGRGVVTAEHAVLATLAPITDRGLETARLRPMRAYGIAATVDGDLPDGMYLSAGEPSRSFRVAREGDTTYLVLVGEGHAVGHEHLTDRNLRALEDAARAHFPVSEVTHRWSAHDHVAEDLLPFVGTTAFAERIHVATGFRKWGLTNATWAADLLADVIAGRSPAHAEVFAPTRLPRGRSAREVAERNVHVAKQFVSDRVSPDLGSLEQIPPGSGATVRVDGDLVAASRDDDGRLTVCSATCTHLGCIVHWNQAERSWDCPCHGSRFDSQGEVLDGPATSSLARRSPPASG